jgi:hypothetical protein
MADFGPQAYLLFQHVYIRSVLRINSLPNDRLLFICFFGLFFFLFWPMGVDDGFAEGNLRLVELKRSMFCEKNNEMVSTACGSGLGGEMIKWN